MEDEDKKKKILKDALDKFKDVADVDEDSDIPVTEKKTKEKKFKEYNQTHITKVDNIRHL